MPDQRQMSRSVGRSWRWHHPSASLGTFYPRWQLQTCFYPKTPWSRVANSMSAWPSSPADHFPSSEEDGSTIRELGAPCCMQEKPSPKLIWLASPATQWARYDTLDVRCHHQGQSQLAKSSVKDVGWWSGKCTTHPPTKIAQTCRTWQWLAEESPETQFHRREWPWPPEENLDRNE